MSKNDKGWLMWSLGGWLALAVAGCGTGGTGGAGMTSGAGQTWILDVGSEVPAASGSVNVKPLADGNQQIEVQVEHLAPPDRAVPGASAYVVWLKPQGHERAMNMGHLAVDADLKGTLQTVTPYRDFDVFITAERNPRVAEPAGKRELMRASVLAPQRTVR